MRSFASPSLAHVLRLFKADRRQYGMTKALARLGDVLRSVMLTRIREWRPVRR